MALVLFERVAACWRLERTCLPTAQIIGTPNGKWNEFSISIFNEIFFAFANDFAYSVS